MKERLENSVVLMTQKSLRAEEEAILIFGLPTFSPHLAREMIDSHNGQNGGETKKKKQNNREKWSYAVMWIVSRLKIYADWSTPMPFSRQFTMLGPRGSTAIGRVIIANYKLFVENEISVFLKWNAQNSRLRYLKRKRNENVGYKHDNNMADIRTEKVIQT